MIYRLLILSLILFFTLQIKGQEAFLSNRLIEALEEDKTEYHHISILLNDRVDITLLDLDITARKAKLNERAKTVITALKNKASDTQKPLLSLLNSIPGIKQESIRSYWINNIIFVKASKEAIAILSKLPEIHKLDLNGELALVEYTSSAPELLPLLPPDGAEIGLKAINAHKLWELGYTGRGRCILGADTGIEPDHPALNGQYLGLYYNPSQTWYSWNNVIPSPADCNGHGTHTVGTVLGIDRVTNDTIGVAPNANFIGARILCSQAQGNGGTADNVGSFQWALDPDGDPNTINDMPDAINNSWYDPQIDDDCDNVYVDALKALEAAGIAVVFSAGNEGDEGAASITNPHNINYDLVNTFTVGALNGNSVQLPIADFSSLGPSSCGGEGSLLIKPEVSAPGVAVRSATLDNEYAFLQGTSMAAPHVAGAILLLKEAFPFLTGRDFKLALYFTCRDLGDPGEDNTFGMGIIDVKAAYDYLIDQGHEPVDPSLAFDAVLYNIETNEVNCDNQVPATIYIENLGTQTIEKMNIEMHVEKIDLIESMTWEGVLPAGDRISIVLDPLDLPDGIHELEVTITSVNEREDEFFFNNRLVEEVSSSSLIALNAEVVNFQDKLCKNSRALLRSYYPGTGSGLGPSTNPGKLNFVWYDRPENGLLLDTGQFFTTPPLKNSSSYYAGAFIEYDLGESDNSISNAVEAPAAFGGISFDVHLPLVIKSVKVYANQTGIGSIVIQNSEGENVGGHIFAITETGEQIAELNLPLEEGTGYTMEATGVLPFVYNVDGADFPYSVDGLISLTGTTLEDDPFADPYLYFYDWKVERNEICGRVPVFVEVNEKDSIPEANFSVSETEVMIDNNPTIDFMDLSSGAQSWRWDFGDGNFSEEQNPSYTYSEPGTYQVSLIVENNEGCQDASVLEINVLPGTTATSDTDLSELHVFPNPASDFLIISFEKALQFRYSVTISDLSGKQIRNFILGSSRHQEDISGLESGLYIIVVENGNEFYSSKFVVL